ncbi:MAG TPA: FixH family protein [Blastocatellia bacterium]|nr:FixH family protein [Blastocatellia bacterium]
MAVCVGCSSNDATHGEEEEAESRTEFTDRVENFFEYAPLKVGKESQFLIHLTDLSDGSPVEKADVVLTIRDQSSKAEIGQVKAKVGRVAGIYVADVTIPRPGVYEIDFHIKNDKLDERMPLTDFQVQ